MLYIGISLAVSLTLFSFQPLSLLSFQSPFLAGEGLSVNRATALV